MMFAACVRCPSRRLSINVNAGRSDGPFQLIEDNSVRVVRKGGLEPPRYCYRQPLKLVRLPIPPLPLMEPGTRNQEWFLVREGGVQIL
jgi:hypothetical protein